MLTPYVFARNMFDEIFDSAFSGNNASSMMNTDIKETDQGYELMVDIPGVKREDLTAELKDGHLIISASIARDNNNESQSDGKYIRRERFTGSYSRSFYVGDKVHQEDIKGRFEDGVLHLFIPKIVNTPKIEEKKLIAIEG